MAYFVVGINTNNTGVTYYSGDGFVVDLQDKCLALPETHPDAFKRSNSFRQTYIFDIGMGAIPYLCPSSTDYTYSIFDDTDLTTEVLNQNILAQLIAKKVKIGGVRLYKHRTNRRYVFAKMSLDRPSLNNHIEFVKREAYFKNTNRFNPNFIESCTSYFRGKDVTQIALSGELITICSKGETAVANMRVNLDSVISSGVIKRDNLPIPWVGSRGYVKDISEAFPNTVKGFVLPKRVLDDPSIGLIIEKWAKAHTIFDVYQMYVMFGGDSFIGIQGSNDDFIVDTPFDRYYYKISPLLKRTLITKQLLGR